MVDPMDTTPPAPGERRLAHPPSDRYRTTEAGRSPEASQPATPARGVAFGALAGIAGAAVITILGGVLTVTAGLLIVAVATGWAIGLGLRVGGGSWRAGRGRGRIGIALALLAIALGQAGLWAYARTEGGVLAPLDFLWQVYGGLVPVEFAAGGLAAWIAAR